LGSFRQGAAVSMQRAKGLFSWQQGNYTEHGDGEELDTKEPPSWSAAAPAVESAKPKEGIAPPTSDTPWDQAANVRARLQEELRREGPVSVASPKQRSRTTISSTDQFSAPQDSSDLDGAQRRERSEKRRQKRRSRNSSCDGAESASDNPFNFPASGTDSARDLHGFPTATPWPAQQRQPLLAAPNSPVPPAGSVAPATPSAAAASAWPAAHSSPSLPAAAAAPWLPSQGSPQPQIASPMPAPASAVAVAAPAPQATSPEQPPAETIRGANSAAKGVEEGNLPTDSNAIDMKAMKVDHAPGMFDEAILAALAALPQHSLVDILRRLQHCRAADVALAVGLACTQPSTAYASATPSACSQGEFVSKCLQSESGPVALSNLDQDASCTGVIGAGDNRGGTGSVEAEQKGLLEQQSQSAFNTESGTPNGAFINSAAVDDPTSSSPSKTAPSAGDGSQQQEVAWQHPGAGQARSEAVVPHASPTQDGAAPLGNSLRAPGSSALPPSGTLTWGSNPGAPAPTPQAPPNGAWPAAAWPGDAPAQAASPAVQAAMPRTPSAPAAAAAWPGDAPAQAASHALQPPMPRTPSAPAAAAAWPGDAPTQAASPAVQAAMPRTPSTQAAAAWPGDAPAQPGSQPRTPSAAAAWPMSAPSVSASPAPQGAAARATPPPSPAMEWPSASGGSGAGGWPAPSSPGNVAAMVAEAAAAAGPPIAGAVAPASARGSMASQGNATAWPETAAAQQPSWPPADAWSQQPSGSSVGTGWP